MTVDQFGGLLRAVLASLVAFAAGKGWIAAGDADWIVGGVVTGLIGAWSWWTNRPAKLAK
jgi:hypothetical protein